MTFNHAAIHNNRTKPDQAFGFDRAPMQHRHMADQGIVFDDRWKADHATLVRVAVDDCAILNIAARADAYRIHIPAQHTIIPDACAFADFDIADDPAARRNKSRRVNARRIAVERYDRNILHHPFIVFAKRAVKTSRTGARLA